MHTHHRNQQSRHENPIRKRHDALKRIGTNEPQSTGMKGLARQAIQDWRKYLTAKVLLRARETGCPKKSRDLVPTFEANPVVFQRLAPGRGISWGSLSPWLSAAL